jgi:peptide/nickel transport system ATP-binding protein
VAGARPDGAGVDGPLLEVRDLHARHGARSVLHGVSLELRARECLALVGESGSGKTTLARAIIGLHPSQIGEVRFRGVALAPRARSRPLELCRQIQYVFQSPTSSLNPRRSIGDIVRTPVEHFSSVRGRDSDARVAELLERVSLPAAAAVRYPGELSGGERQRVSIARALAAQPEVLVCDEITSALDASVQAAIVTLLAELRASEQLAILFVTHDLALVRSIADRVVVLNAGRIVESGATDVVLEAPSHPYTAELVADTPAMRASTSTHPVDT